MLLRNMQALVDSPEISFRSPTPTIRDIAANLAHRTGLEVSDITVAGGAVEEVRSVTITSNGTLPQGVAPQVDDAVPRQVNSAALVSRLCGASDGLPVSNRMNARAGNGQLCVHVSELADLCVRQFVLSARLDCYPPTTVTGGHRVMWAIGHALEKHVRDQVVTARNREGIYGLWSCDCGETEYTGEFPANEHCSLCHQELSHLGEPHLVDAENGVMGSPDLTLILDTEVSGPPGEVRMHHLHEVVEIKSMTIDQWRALEEPLANHKAQALLYRHLYQILGHSVSDVVRIIYVAKDFVYGSPYKEFVVDAHEEVHVAMVETSLALARQVQDALANEHTTRGNLPERVCSGAACPRAKKCGVAVPCFNME